MSLFPPPLAPAQVEAEHDPALNITHLDAGAIQLTIDAESNTAMIVIPVDVLRQFVALADHPAVRALVSTDLLKTV